MKNLLFIIAVLVCACAFAQDWEWLNPLPTGFTLNGIAFRTEQECWAVGMCGAMLRSTDSGQNWQSVPSATYKDLADIVFVQALNGWAIGDSGTVLRTTDGGSTWSAINAETGGALHGVSFANESLGWVVGCDNNLPVIRHTTDGGLTWLEQQAPPTRMKRLYGVFFLNDTLGWAVGAEGSRIHTTNGGLNWTDQTGSWQSRTLNSVYFVNDSLGWTVGDAKILQTTDGGANWYSQAGGWFNYLRVWFSDASNGIAVGDTISRTTNGGENWSRRSGSGLGYACSAQGFSILVGEYGQILRSQAGDTAWQSIQTGIRAGLNAVTFADSLSGWAVGEGGMIMRSVNGGRSWDTCAMLDHWASFNKVTATDSLHAWIAGYYGALARTSDGGRTWTEPADNLPTFIEDLCWENSLSGWFVGEQGSIMKTTDGGDSWFAQTSNTSYYLNGIASAGNGRAYAVGDLGTILVTNDGGQTWTQAICSATTPLIAVTAYGSNLAWASGTDDAIWYTDNGGVSWEMISRSGIAARRLHFYDALNGWITNGRNQVLRTTDGGLSWIRINAVYGVAIQDVCVLPDGKGWAVGDHGAILRFNTTPLTSVESPTAGIPRKITLSVYPNPFNPRTTIAFDLPSDERVTLMIYDITGRLVETLADAVYSRGMHTIGFDGSRFASGVYFARLNTATAARTQELLLLK